MDEVDLLADLVLGAEHANLVDLDSLLGFGLPRLDGHVEGLQRSEDGDGAGFGEPVLDGKEEEGGAGASVDGLLDALLGGVGVATTRKLMQNFSNSTKKCRTS